MKISVIRRGSSSSNSKYITSRQAKKFSIGTILIFAVFRKANSRWTNSCFIGKSLRKHKEQRRPLLEVMLLSWI